MRVLFKLSSNLLSDFYMGLISFNTHWFDLVTLTVLGIGIYNGRKRGMSDDLLRVIQWLVMLFVGAKFYHPLGMALANWMQIQPNTAFVMVYVALVIGVKVAFDWLRRGLGEKLVGSDFFGNWEHHLGMATGMVRYGCMLLMALALLNAVYVTEEEIWQSNRVQNENAGNISSETIGEMQRQIFDESKAGRVAKLNFNSALINAVPPVTYKREKIKGYGARMEDAANEALGPLANPPAAKAEQTKK